MYSNLQTFIFEGQKVRTVTIDCEPWFVVQDVCDVLGIRQAAGVGRKILRNSEMRKENIPTVFSRKGMEQTGTRKMLLTNESGIYTLIMRSNKEEAIGFRAWVTEEVLPSIRKTGSYSIASRTSEVAETVGASSVSVPLGNGVTLTITITITPNQENA